MAEVRRDSGCPSDEVLLAHVLEPKAVNPVAAHLDSCDACVFEVSRLSSRLAIADEVAVRVPADVLRAAQARPQPAQARRSFSEWLAELGSSLTWLRPQVFVPAAAMALLALVVGVQTRQSSSPVELTRDVQITQEARVTQAQAILRDRPDRQGLALRTLGRGDNVVLSERREDWYQASLADGTRGWIEVEAFE